MEINPFSDSLCTLLPAYVLSALDATEVQTFETHLADGCAHCAAELQTWSSVTADLACLAPPQSPPQALSARVQQRIAADSQARLEEHGLLFARSAQLEWSPLPIEGLEIKVLSTDNERNLSTLLVRMRPGAAYPAHRHAAVEELFLLEGDLLVSGVLMRAGDYCRAEPGSLHTDIRSDSGCLFLSTSSVDDEVLV